MEDLKAKLIGELVGLARATDGNEHLISEASTSVIRECLAAVPVNKIELENLLCRVEEAKRAMVPDCFLCANPCGKTAGIDLREFDRAGSDEREAKLRILSNLVAFSATATETALYRGLIALGLDGMSPEFLDSIAKELHP